ncbi:MAG: hypothetical protein IPP87_07525 [Ideonella sp.]|nr:hypothetical protein [Ideonella sp.]
MQIEAHRALVRQATTLFGARPWRHYDLLLATGEGLHGTALEHRESSETVLTTDYFKDWAGASRDRDTVAHEFAHAWNDKFRRPADLLASDFNTPTQNSLLWVYEGLTQYYGMVLAARAGLVSPEQIRHRIGRSAAHLRELPGRRWRNLQDTTNDPAIASSAWPSWEDAQPGLLLRIGAADLARCRHADPPGHRWLAVAGRLCTPALCRRQRRAKPFDLCLRGRGVRTLCHPPARLAGFPARASGPHWAAGEP